MSKCFSGVLSSTALFQRREGGERKRLSGEVGREQRRKRRRKGGREREREGKRGREGGERVGGKEGGRKERKKKAEVRGLCPLQA